MRAKIAFINSKDGAVRPYLMTDQKIRWKEYFQELHNPITMTEHFYEAKDQETLEPETLCQEIKTAIRNNSRNK